MKGTALLLIGTMLLSSLAYGQQGSVAEETIPKESVEESVAEETTKEEPIAEDVVAEEAVTEETVGEEPTEKPLAVESIRMVSETSFANQDLYAAGNSIHSSISLSLASTGLFIVSMVYASTPNSNPIPVLMINVGSLICSIASIAKHWEAGTNLKRASGMGK